MKNTLLKTILVLTTLVITGTNYAQKKETVTITGKVTVEGTRRPPIGVITVLEKGAVAYWSDETKEEIGTNIHTFVEKDGTFKFTINKGGTIIIWDAGKRYKPRTIFKLNKSQSIDIVLTQIKRANKSENSMDELKEFEKKTDIHKRIKISGRITFPDGKGMRNATISQPEVSSERIPLFAHIFSGNDGAYSYTVLKGGRISFAASGYEKQIFTATKDTVINVKMKRVNPFR